MPKYSVHSEQKTIKYEIQLEPLVILHERNLQATLATLFGSNWYDIHPERALSFTAVEGWIGSYLCLPVFHPFCEQLYKF